MFLIALAGECFASAGSLDGLCFGVAADRYELDELLLRAIGRVESRYNPHAINPTSGAIGVMQIHPWHLDRLKRHKITRKELLDPCININVGAWILWEFVGQYGSTWRAVGAFGAGTKKDRDTELARIAYIKKVQAAYRKLQEEAAGSA